MHWTESQIIAKILEIFNTRSSISPRGIGDDCAVIDMSSAHSGKMLVTTDASVEHVHFDLSWMSLADAAYRCMTSNLSDVAAMGGFPGPFSLALGLRSDIAFEEIVEAILALKTCIEDHHLDNCWLIGGDVVRSDHVFFSITLMAPCPKWPVVLRNGAKSGNVILVLGNPGRSAAGLAILSQKKNRPEMLKTEWQPLIQAFCRPKACTQIGPEMARRNLATSMMDLSDGIYTDLPRLMAESGIAASIDLNSLVPDRIMGDLAQALNKDPRDWMLFGGEDFGLIMTCAEKDVMTIQDLAHDYGVPCHIIGTCHAGNGITWSLDGRVVVPEDQSFVHF